MKLSHEIYPSTTLRHSELSALPGMTINPSERLITPQRRDHLFAEQADRAHQFGLGQVGEIELAHEHVEQAGFGRGAVFLCYRLGRADEHQLVLEQIVGVEQV